MDRGKISDCEKNSDKEKILDREKVKSVFKQYTDHYDSSDIKIRLKIQHTYKVAAIAERIAESLQLDAEGRDCAWLLGMLHDVGRFEQVRQYGTFNDRASVDHAQLGADILFSQGMIADFAGSRLPGGSGAADAGNRKMLETAIRLHNQLSLPAEIDGRTRMFCQILRDADKADIFRVLAEVPYAQTNAGFKNMHNTAGARAQVMECVKKHCCVPRMYERTEFESLVSHCCMAFELVYPESRTIVREQGCLARLLDGGKWSPAERKQLGMLRREIEKEWKAGIQ